MGSGWSRSVQIRSSFSHTNKWLLGFKIQNQVVNIYFNIHIDINRFFESSNSIYRYVTNTSMVYQCSSFLQATVSTSWTTSSNISIVICHSIGSGTWFLALIMAFKHCFIQSDANEIAEAVFKKLRESSVEMQTKWLLKVLYKVLASSAVPAYIWLSYDHLLPRLTGGTFCFGGKFGGVSVSSIQKNLRKTIS